MTILELVKKLFGIKRQAPAAVTPGEELVGIIKDALTLNLKFVTGNDVVLSLSKTGQGLFEKALASMGTGYISSYYGFEETPCMQFFISAAGLESLFGRMKAVHSDIPREHGRALDLLIDWTGGRLYRMFLPGQGDNVEQVLVKREFGPADIQAIMWGVSDSVVFTLKAGGFTAYISVPQKIWDSLLTAVMDRDFAWRLRSLAVTEYTGEGGSEPGGEPASIDITRPGEFLLGRFFLPALLKADDTVISSSFKNISSGSDLPSPGFFRVSLDIKTGEEIYRIWYCFEGDGPAAFNTGTSNFDSLFKLILRDTVSGIKAACPELNVSGIRYNVSPEPVTVADSVVLHSELKVNFKPVNTLIAVPPQFVNLIALNILSPWEVQLLQSTSRNMILGVLSVNAALFSRGIGTFLNSFRGGGEDLPVVLSCMPFYEFMELIGDSDLKIIAQNFILPALSSSYMKLFRVGVADHTSPDTAVCRLYTVNSDWKRINKFLPRNVLEDAEAELQWTGSEHFDALNRQTMMDLFAAADSDRIVLSARAQFILKNQFFDAVQAGFGSELERLRAAGEPFASLEGLAYNIRQLAVTRVSDRDLCLVMLDAGEKVQALTPLLSRARRVKIMDDLDVLKREYRMNRITPGEVVKAIHAVKESLEKEKVRV